MERDLLEYLRSEFARIFLSKHFQKRFNLSPLGSFQIVEVHLYENVQFSNDDFEERPLELICCFYKNKFYNSYEEAFSKHEDGKGRIGSKQVVPLSELTKIRTSDLPIGMEDFFWITNALLDSGFNGEFDNIINELSQNSEQINIQQKVTIGSVYDR